MLKSGTVQTIIQLPDIQAIAVDRGGGDLLVSTLVKFVRVSLNTGAGPIKCTPIIIPKGNLLGLAQTRSGDWITIASNVRGSSDICHMTSEGFVLGFVLGFVFSCCFDVRL